MRVTAQSAVCEIFEQVQIGTRSTQPYELKDVVFDHVYYGAGSEPNNASSFISRAAKGAKAVSTRNVTGYTVSHLYTQEEEG